MYMYCIHHLYIFCHRLRKRDLKLFESFGTLDKNHRKYSDRLKSCQKRLTVARNDYLLAVTQTNAHLRRHSVEDLPKVMEVGYIPTTNTKRNCLTSHYNCV